MGNQPFGIAPEVLPVLAAEIAEVRALGVEVAVVIGGGNIIRGIAATEQGLDRVTGDYMGMLATIINALALQDALEKRGCFTRVLTAVEMREVAEPFIRRRAIRHLEKGRVVIFAAGTGNPFFTTDSAAALRASEIHADALLKGTKVDGLYTADPAQDAGARLLKRASYQYLLEHGLQDHGRSRGVALPERSTYPSGSSTSACPATSAAWSSARTSARPSADA